MSVHVDLLSQMLAAQLITNICNKQCSKTPLSIVAFCAVPPHCFIQSRSYDWLSCSIKLLLLICTEDVHKMLNMLTCTEDVHEMLDMLICTEDVHEMLDMLICTEDVHEMFNVMICT